MRGAGSSGVLSPVNADRNLTSRRAEFLVQPPVRSNPHVLFGDFHLQS